MDVSFRALSVLLLLLGATLLASSLLVRRRARLWAPERLVAQCRSMFKVDPIEDMDSNEARNAKQRQVDLVLEAILLQWNDSRVSDEELLSAVGLAEACGFQTDRVADQLPRQRSQFALEE